MHLGYNATDSEYYTAGIIEEPTEESDVLNDQTFGVDPITEEEWDITDIAEQTENIDKVRDLNFNDLLIGEAQSNEKVVDPAREWYKNYDKSFQETIGKDLCNLLIDDDEPSNFESSPNSSSVKGDLGSFLTKNCSMTPFFDLNPSSVESLNSIWKSALTVAATRASGGSQKPSNDATTSSIDDTTTEILSIDNSHSDRLINNSSSLDPNSIKSLVDELRQSKLVETDRVKKVRTLAELEAELLDKTRQQSVSSDGVFAAAAQSSGDSRIASDQRHDRVSPFDILAGPEAIPATVSAGAFKAPPTVAPSGPLLSNQQKQQHQQALLLAAAFLGQQRQQQQRPLHYPSPPWTLDPQMRAVALACLAAGKPLPPGFLRPPLIPPHPLAVRYGMPIPPGLNPNNVIDPRLIMAAQASLVKPNESVPSLVKIRPIVSVQNVANQRFSEPKRPHDYRAAPFGRTFVNQQYQQRIAPVSTSNDVTFNDDEYTDLMSKSERNWLIKVQSVQLFTQNPYRDDYYWLMYKRKKEAAVRSNEIIENSDQSTDYLDATADSREVIEHRSYIPPSFEGSLGKLQSSSSSGPRQIIDVRGYSLSPRKNVCSLNDREESNHSTPSTSHESGSTTPAVSFNFSTPLSRSKLNTGLLLDIENAYLLALECDEWLVELKAFNMHYMSDRIRENLDKIISNTSRVMSLIASDTKKFQSVLYSRKGRRLITKILPFLQDAERTIVINLFADLLLKKTSATLDEACIFFLGALHETLKNSDSSNWSSIFTCVLTPVRLQKPLYTKSERFFNIVVVLLYHCARQNSALSEGVIKNITEYLSIVMNDMANLNSRFVVRSKSIGLSNEDVKILIAYLSGKSMMPPNSVQEFESFFRFDQ